MSVLPSSLTSTGEIINDMIVAIVPFRIVSDSLPLQSRTRIAAVVVGEGRPAMWDIERYTSDFCRSLLHSYIKATKFLEIYQWQYEEG